MIYSVLSIYRSHFCTYRSQTPGTFSSPVMARCGLLHLVLHCCVPRNTVLYWTTAYRKTNKYIYIIYMYIYIHVHIYSLWKYMNKWNIIKASGQSRMFQLRTSPPEAGIQGRDKESHSCLGCKYPCMYFCMIDEWSFIIDLGYIASIYRIPCSHINYDVTPGVQLYKSSF